MNLHLMETVKGALLIGTSEEQSAPLLEALNSIGLRARLASLEQAESVQVREHFRLVFLLSDLGDNCCGSTIRSMRDAVREFVYVVGAPQNCESATTADFDQSPFDDLIFQSDSEFELRRVLRSAVHRLEAEDALQASEAALARAREDLSLRDESLHAACNRFEQLFVELPAACFTIDRDGKIMEWNQAASSLFGTPGHLAVEMPVSEVLSKSIGTIWDATFVGSLFNGKAAYEFDWEYPDANGGVRYLAGKVIGLHHGQGEMFAAVSVNVDVTERKLAERRISEYARQLGSQTEELKVVNDRLAQLAVTDGLTQLSNHRRFTEELDEVHRVHANCAMPYSLLLFDVDHFKSVNDELGHQFGDRVLKLFADILRSTCRSGEHPARYGGEEFVVILRTCGADAALEAAERFQNALRAYDWPVRPIRASIGVSTLDDPAIQSVDLLRQADEALYASKRGGRDRVTHYAELVESEARSA